MDEPEYDAPTGRKTTGHEWNGIKELDNPVPKVVLAFLAITFTFSVIYWVIAPAWPLGVTYTRGLLGLNDRTEVTRQVEAAAADRAAFTRRLESEPFASLAADPALMAYVDETAPTLFEDNCAACHGSDRQGGPGYPNLVASPRLWGGEPEAVAETIRVGINGDHPQTRRSQMSAFGEFGTLDRDQIQAVSAYIRSLSGQDLTAAERGRVASGAAIFATTCASCHGVDGRGDRNQGAPNLADDVWIYGGDAETVYETIQGGRQGHMPSWEGRLSPADIRMLTLYIDAHRGSGR
jgi:cytochrome c oxidase cbb3-type subunit 3